MDKQKVMAKLIWDLQSFLSVLDSENLSYIAQAQKKSILELLSKLQSHDNTVEDAEYMVMSCPSSSPVNDSPGTGGLRSSELTSDEETPSMPPHPLGGLQGKEDEDDAYEEAEPYVSASITAVGAESDSSHYESYGEDASEGAEPVKDRAHYLHWSSSQPCLRPRPESARLCSFLWRRKWLGQWSKQLFIVRGNQLLCYKCARDLLPQLELDLRGCRISYKSKTGKKIQHQLKVLPRDGEPVVLGFSSGQQVEEWRQLVEELSIDTRSVSSLNPWESCRSSVVQTDSEEEELAAPCSLSTDQGFLNVLMNCQWQNLLCRVEDGLLNMFAQEEPEEPGEPGQHSPQYTVRLRGCEVTDGPDAPRSLRITLSMLGDQLAVLEVSSPEAKRRWMQLLQGGAHGDSGDHRDAAGALSGLQTRRFPTCNANMDNLFHLSTSGTSQPLYSNCSVLEHMLDGSQDSVSSRDSVTYSNTVLSCSSRKSPESQRVVQKLELTGRRRVHLCSGSETNLAAAGTQNKRTFRQSLAVCTERAQTGFLNPLLRRTNSAKNSLRRAPSAIFIEPGKVFQKRKEWETKAST